VFQKHLADQPMMRSVIADMALEMEGVVALVMRLARAFDRAAADPAEAAFARLMTPAVKYYVCKTAPAFIYEAMECLGGNGYVEDGVLARLYREAPVNAIWEGSGNVMCLDVLRAATREVDASRAVLAQLEKQATGLPGVSEAVRMIEQHVTGASAEAGARVLVERLALLAAAAALQTSGARAAEPFAKSRLMSVRGATYGASELDADNASLLIDRVLPVD